MELPGLGVLSVLPVVWISVSRLSPAAVVSISFLGPLLAGLPWYFAAGAEERPGRIASMVLLALTTLAVSVAIQFVRAQVLRQQRKVEAKEAELQALLTESRERERLLNAILDTVDVGIVAIDADGRRLLTNSWQTALEASAAPAGGRSARRDQGLGRTAAADRSRPSDAPAGGTPPAPPGNGRRVLRGPSGLLR